MFERTKINEKEAGIGPYKQFLTKLKISLKISFRLHVNLGKRKISKHKRFIRNVPTDIGRYSLDYYLVELFFQ